MAKLTSIAPYGFIDLPTVRLLAVLRELGVRALQFYRNEANPPTPQEALRVAGDAGLTFDSIHGVFGPAYDPSSPDEALRQASVDAYRREGELALELGGPMVVVHPSPLSTRRAVVHSPEAPQRVDALRRSIAQLTQIGEELGVTYLIENLPPDYPVGRPALVAALVREADDPRLRMCVDVGHAHIGGDTVEAMRACRDVAGYLHVHDNNSRRDSHLFPGDGTVPWEQMAGEITALPADMPAMIELFQSADEFRRRAADGLAAQLTHWLALGGGR